MGKNFKLCIELGPEVENVVWYDQCIAENNRTGTLYLTNTHLIFASKVGKELWVTYCQIANVQLAPYVNGSYCIVIVGKTFFSLTLLVQNQSDCLNVFDSLVALSRPSSIEELPAFSYVPRSKDLKREDGWSDNCGYDDYARLGLPNEKWTISELNKNFEYCEGYPERIFVPRHVPAPVLIGSLKFRSRGRLPVLSYLYSKNEAVICRCSQPLAGFSARCIEDESLMRHIAKTNPQSKTLFIVDTRPKINAMVNKATGKGFEDERNYNNVRYHFFAIENIHAVRTSLQKMLDVIWSKKNVSMSSFLTGMVNSGWLKHIRSILETASFISEAVSSGTSVVVHCSDGWDRTPQTVSLACILLDPYYRTIKGFQTLIEKEWLMYGHKFSDRCAHVYSADSKEIAPIFTQFLDAVWQLMEQFPTEFEFNERYLMTLQDHLYSCQFGTFLCNSHKERLELKLCTKTYSLWGYLAQREEDLKNPLYNSDRVSQLLKPDLRPQQITLWRSMYNRYDISCREETLLNTVIAFKQQIDSLSLHIDFLNQIIEKFVKVDQTPTSEQSKLQGNGNELISTLTDSAIGSSGSDTASNSQKDLQNSSPVDELSRRGTVAIRWAVASEASKCSNVQCNTSFWPGEYKHHCWCCGLVFCSNCTSSKAILPGHEFNAARRVPVCQRCNSRLLALQKIA
uniref:phosphatidylinositol-3,5-bisphosphate 3-phosphatase n=1 Tax=Trichuris muris TaxID=70415 RepID=A0A5S6QLC9_TRIMR